MKISSIIFIILIFLVAFKYTKIFNVSWVIIIGVFVLWFIAVYIKIHIKNREKSKPQPVYVTGWEG